MTKLATGAVSVLGSLLGILIKAITPALKDLVEDGVKKLYVKAKSTDSDIDDAFVEALATVLGIDLEV